MMRLLTVITAFMLGALLGAVYFGQGGGSEQSILFGTALFGHAQDVWIHLCSWAIASGAVLCWIFGKS